MDTVSFLLFPIMEAMRLILVALHTSFGSYGVAIIVLSVIVRLITAPISKWAAGAETREQKVQLTMEPELSEIRRTSTGRERFERTEALYKRHNYHPIKSIASLTPLFLQIPFLLSALFFLSGFAPLSGERFLIISDLLLPDRLFSVQGVTINVLPLAITVIALMESTLSFPSTKQARRRFLIVSVVISILIYTAPAGVCLYWLTSNLISFSRTLVGRAAHGTS